MITPNKVLTLDESVLSRLSTILRAGPTPIRLSSLYQNVSGSFESIDMFILALDVLYILKKIDIDLITGIVTYVD